MNIFKGMSWSEIGIVVTLGTSLAVVVALLLTATVYLLPIADKFKVLVLLLLGFLSIFIGYAVLIRMPPKSQQRNPATIKPTDHSQDSWSTFKEINRNFSHIPTMPNRAIAISSPPSIKSPKTSNALPILSSIIKLLQKFKLR